MNGLAIGSWQLPNGAKCHCPLPTKIFSQWFWQLLRGAINGHQSRRNSTLIRKAEVEVLQSGSCRDLDMMAQPLLQSLLAACNSFSSYHIAGLPNAMVDALSRFQQTFINWLPSFRAAGICEQFSGHSFHRSCYISSAMSYSGRLGRIGDPSAWWDCACQRLGCNSM